MREAEGLGRVGVRCATRGVPEEGCLVNGNFGHSAWAIGRLGGRKGGDSEWMPAGKTYGVIRPYGIAPGWGGDGDRASGEGALG